MTALTMNSKDVLALDAAGLRRLTWRDIGNRILTEPEISHIFKLCDSLWLHSGDPADPHAELTSGKCSNGFVDTLRTLCHTNLCELFAKQLVMKLEEELNFVNCTSIASELWVVGSDHAGAAFSHSVATWLGAKHDFTEKDGLDSKVQAWKRFTIKRGEAVLQVEELVTTTNTLKAVRKGIRNGNPEQVGFLPFVTTLVHRSKEDQFDGEPILYLVHYDIETWDGPDSCPLCAKGSKRLRPKQHWLELTGKH